MVYNTGFSSVVESKYLGLGLTHKLIKASVVVNPKPTMRYLSGKTIIINLPMGITKEFILALKRRNEVILRFPMFDFEEYEPYSLEPVNTITYSNVSSSTPAFEKGFDFTNYKDDEYSDLIYVDSFSYISNEVYNESLTVIGFTCHQIGLITDKMSEVGCTEEFRYSKVNLQYLI